jgi:hypothetical protein
VSRRAGTVQIAVEDLEDALDHWQRCYTLADEIVLSIDAQRLYRRLRAIVRRARHAPKRD